MILLGVLGSILTLCIGVSEIWIITLIDDVYGIATKAVVALLPAAGHAVASAFAYNHFREKCGLSELKFVVLNALPSFIIGTLGFIAFCMMIASNYGNALEWLMMVYISLCVIGYSLAYAVLLSVLLGIKLAVGNRKEHL